MKKNDRNKADSVYKAEETIKVIDFLKIISQF
jgi:hypothetical protein